MNGEYIALLIGIIIFSLCLALPRRRSFQDELDENAKKVKKERLERMQK